MRQSIKSEPQPALGVNKIYAQDYKSDNIQSDIESHTIIH